MANSRRRESTGTRQQPSRVTLRQTDALLSRLGVATAATRRAATSSTAAH